MIDLVEEADAFGGDIGLQSYDRLVKTIVTALLDYALRRGRGDWRRRLGWSGKDGDTGTRAMIGAGIFFLRFIISLLGRRSDCRVSKAR